MGRGSVELIYKRVAEKYEVGADISITRTKFLGLTVCDSTPRRGWKVVSNGLGPAGGRVLLGIGDARSVTRGKQRPVLSVDRVV